MRLWMVTGAPSGFFEEFVAVGFRRQLLDLSKAAGRVR